MFLENDPYMLNIRPQVKSMKPNDSKHIEIDDRFNLYVVCVGKELYTGWIYWVKGNIPAMTFTSSNIYQIIQQAYEENLFMNYTEGSTYNKLAVNSIEENIQSIEYN